MMNNFASDLRVALENAISELTNVIERIRRIAEESGTAVKREQQRGLTRLISDLEKKGVPVPEDVRRLSTQIETELEENEGAEELLTLASDSLEQLTRTVSRKRSVNGELQAATSVSSMKDLIIEVLREHDGAGRRREILGWISTKMEGRFLPGDLQESPSGSIYWHNVASHARHMMVKEGILREGSAVGVWELDE